MNLENLGVQEMNAQEVKQVEGGFAICAAIFIGCCIAAFAGVVADWDNFEKGISGNY